MKIGYPSYNLSLTCRPSKTFRLASFTKEKFLKTVENNLACLSEILEFNKFNNLLFFRISSDLIPFASHPVCKIPWQKIFKQEFFKLGEFIKDNRMRISMHPDQFILLNSLDEKIFQNSLRELIYHAEIFDLMELTGENKIQLHVGGAYGNKPASMERFLARYELLPLQIKRRLVIENDDRLYSLRDCLWISRRIKIPVLFDLFHHEILNNGESTKKAVELASLTWKKSDGILMVDFSHGQKKKNIGLHDKSINLGKFKKFIREVENLDLDIMLEIKDKEKSALKTKRVLKELGRR